MSHELVVVHALEEPPRAWNAAVFLAGPTPRSPDVPSWRPGAIEALRALWAGEGRLGVFVPEHRDQVHDDYVGQIEWEERCLHLSDEVLFWVPREPATMPAFTTNVEWGMWHDSGRAVFGAPPEAPKNNYLRHYAAKFAVPAAQDLRSTAAAALERIGSGAYRTGGEREVPLLIWRTAGFQGWYGAQRGAGNVLRGSRVVWREGTHWALRVAVYVAAEDRVKSNEMVFSRPDVSVVVLYRRGTGLDDTQVVLVREFRSPAATADGFVHELPGGSGEADPVRAAVAEVAEETGLVLDAGRLRAHGARQVNATMSAHRAHLFSAELTVDELRRLRAEPGPYGVAAASERTYVEVVSFKRVREDRLVDWATFGLVTQTLCEVEAHER